VASPLSRFGDVSDMAAQPAAPGDGFRASRHIASARGAGKQGERIEEAAAKPCVAAYGAKFDGMWGGWVRPGDGWKSDGRCAVVADPLRGDEDPGFIDDAGTERGFEDRGTALDQEIGHPAIREIGPQRGP
jgi:hypothetical protein